MLMGENEQPQEAVAVDKRSSWTFRKLVVAIIGTVLLLLAAAIMLLVAVLTLFQTRRFCSEGI